ncbi:hypothetical protein [Helicobacter turcicus]|uniref:Lipoprotein n=1 Tax=Helicobacter turcicus TaxID=2867412 RepID=A0ABS7JQ53_9HELI|nr:hypothetical protein [Helicobacter turcicus]MBX7491531.1 hypothetical protein [Helicobacter turcicus]MBX7546387.1 hypothetical protein [Helicobacter turcicus]
MAKKSLQRNLIFYFGALLVIFAGCDEQSLNELENKAGQTLQNAMQDSGLKDTLESHTQKLTDFLESNKTQEFVAKQAEILKSGANELSKIIESNKTKELLEQQMKNLNEILESSKNDSPEDTQSI